MVACDGGRKSAVVKKKSLGIMSGKPFTPSEDRMIHSCHRFFVEEKNLRRKIEARDPAKRTARALGI